MQLIIQNWAAIVAVILLFIAFVLAVIRFLRLNREEQLDNLREWLLFAVMQAEQELGGGTGELKLRRVYDMFLIRFPKLALFVPFDLFYELVDEALEKMRSILEDNEAISCAVNGEATPLHNVRIGFCSENKDVSTHV